MDEMLHKIIVLEICEKYCKNKETIQDVVKNFKKSEAFKEMENKIANLSFKIEILSSILCMKKLTNNKADGMVLVDLLKEITTELEMLFMEGK